MPRRTDPSNGIRKPQVAPETYKPRTEVTLDDGRTLLDVMDDFIKGHLVNLERQAPTMDPPSEAPAEERSIDHDAEKAINDDGADDGADDRDDDDRDDEESINEPDLSDAFMKPSFIRRCFRYSDGKGQHHLLLSTQQASDCPFDIESAEWRRTKPPREWPQHLHWPADVMRCRTWDGPCLVCGAPPVRRLFMFREKGIGVITQRTWQKGDYLGDYVGEIRPYNDHENNSYCLAVSINGAKTRRIAMIDAETYGNWARFVNHSCCANLRFKESNVGGYRIYTLIALRDIEVGEELTIDYGPGFIGEGAEADQCHCSEAQCRYKNSKRSDSRKSKH